MKVRPSSGLKIGSGNGGQVAFVHVMSRQSNFSAACSTAGNHIAAWESPKSTTVVLAVVSPKTHGRSDESV